MRSDKSRSPMWKGQGRPFRLLLLTALASFLFGVVGFGEPLENAARVARNGLHPTEASGQIVFVGIDQRSLRTVHAWPWPRSVHAQLIDQLSAAGVKDIYLNVLLEGPTSPTEDAKLARALGRAKNVVIPARERIGAQDGRKINGLPMTPFLANARVASVSLWYDYQNAAPWAPLAGKIAGMTMPSFSASMAGITNGVPGERAKIDYSIEPSTIPHVSAGDVIAGRIGSIDLAGKTVLIGTDAEIMNDALWVPGRGLAPAGIVHIIGAESLRNGMPVDLGYLPAWLAAILIGALALLRIQGRRQIALLVTSSGVFLVGPALLESQQIFLDVIPAVFAFVILGSRLGWLRWKNGALINPQTGLPNLTALREERRVDSSVLIATRVHNYAEIASTLSGNGEIEFVKQIVGRLAVSGEGTKVFQGDEGIFVWLADRDSPLGNHLEALHALFRTPLAIGGRSIDVAVTFGVELGSGKSVTSRLSSALVAADEAWDEQLKWKYHDPAREEEVSWRLSLLGELDAAIDKGEVWIAYQPQVDLKTNRVIGAEALARWTHPIKGPISPAEFVAAAEQQGRIGKLTDFVLERAIATAASINRRDVDFTIAVNISARMLGDRDLIARIRRMLKTHGLRPERLTLELTETEAMHGADGGLAMLDELHRMGVRIAIDDYGTGLSTLDYLKKVPASEIKIDQSFIKAMRTNRSDLIMVQSTIVLAQSLGRTVVAEGVEDPSLLEQLGAMGCDIAQGYAVGRPMGVRELIQRLQIRSARRVA